MTPDYDEDAWRAEALPGHALVRLGAAGGGGRGPLEPVLYPGARVDVEVDGEVRPGRLHLGWVVLDGADVFAG